MSEPMEPSEVAPSRETSEEAELRDPSEVVVVLVAVIERLDALVDTSRFVDDELAEVADRLTQGLASLIREPEQVRAARTIAFLRGAVASGSAVIKKGTCTTGCPPLNPAPYIEVKDGGITYFVCDHRPSH